MNMEVINIDSFWRMIGVIALLCWTIYKGWTIIQHKKIPINRKIRYLSIGIVLFLCLLLKLLFSSVSFFS